MYHPRYFHPFVLNSIHMHVLVHQAIVDPSIPHMHILSVQTSWPLVKLPPANLARQCSLVLCLGPTRNTQELGMTSSERLAIVFLVSRPRSFVTQPGGSFHFRFAPSRVCANLDWNPASNSEGGRRFEGGRAQGGGTSFSQSFESTVPHSESLDFAYRRVRPDDPRFTKNLHGNYDRRN